MKAIDFSPRHDTLIHYNDGSLLPMDVPHYETTKINDCTWMIMSAGDYHYLLAGDESGTAIDTGYGAGNLREYLEELCGKPVPWVINTHDHFDHTANNFYFDMAFMDANAIPLASLPYPSFHGINFPEPDYPKTAVKDGDIVPLKGRELEIFQIGDHTKNGIAILDRTCRMLFTGDELMPGAKSLNQSVEKWKHDLEKLLAHRDEYDMIFGGAGRLKDSIVDDFYEAACNILDGKPSEEKIEDHRKPPADEYDANGHIIYDWREPRPEDRPPMHGTVKKNPNQVEYYYKGYRFSYDKTRIRE